MKQTQAAIASVLILLAGATARMEAQQGPPGGRGAGRGGMSATVFTALDANGDGSLTRDEIRSTFEKWFAEADTAHTGAITREQLAAALSAAFPAPAMPAGGRAQNQTPKPEDVAAMMAVMPASAPARPLRARRVLVLCKAQGFVHSSIPLAAKMVEAMGEKTGAWTTVITYDPADINTDNLKQFDAIFLDSTTGLFLDDPKDSGTTAARKAALLNFVRSGKGLAGIHAATDSYHGVPGTTVSAAPAPAPGRGGPATMLAAAIAPQADQKLSRAAMDSVADTWFDKLDANKTGKVTQAEFAQGYFSLMPQQARPAGPAAPQENAPLWPEFNKMIGGYFKFHWVYPQLITVKIDDPKSPVTAMFHGQEYQIHDETYTFAQDSFSRRNVHVLTSIDYSKMSDEDKAKEPAATRRTDGDYALSYIRREGQGRVFYEAHGHSETVYAIGPFVEHMLAGIQYALGDLKADDSPSVK